MSTALPGDGAPGDEAAGPQVPDPAGAAGEGAGPRPPRVDPARVTKRLAAIVLGSQAPIIALGALAAWGIFGVDDPDLARRYLWAGLALALLCVVAVATLRRPLGFALGWIVQALTLLSGLLLPPMFVVGLMFGALWILAIVQGRKMDALTANYLRRHPS